MNHAVTTWRSPVRVLTGPNVAELAWASQAANHSASTSPLYNNNFIDQNNMSSWHISHKMQWQLCNIKVSHIYHLYNSLQDIIINYMDT